MIYIPIQQWMSIFFVLNGNGVYEIGDEILELQHGDFIKIPFKTYHKLRVEKHHDTLILGYFGIAAK